MLRALNVFLAVVVVAILFLLVVSIVGQPEKAPPMIDGAGPGSSLEGLGSSTVALEAVAAQNAARAAQEAQEAAEAAAAASAAEEAARTSYRSVWDCIADKEEGGNWAFRGSVYSGGLGIMVEAWDENRDGITDIEDAADAPPHLQAAVAERILSWAGRGAWSTADLCGL